LQPDDVIRHDLKDGRQQNSCYQYFFQKNQLILGINRSNGDEIAAEGKAFMRQENNLIKSPITPPEVCSRQLTFVAPKKNRVEISTLLSCNLSGYNI